MTTEQAIYRLQRGLFTPQSLLSSQELKAIEAAYDMAVIALRAQQEAENAKLNENPCKAMQWISVKDRLPDKGGSYIVHSRASGTVFTAHYWARDRRWSGRGINLNVTHWMPLPAEPNTNKNETR